MKDRKKLEEQFGEVVELITPTKHTVVIREQTGDDDDILSSGKDVSDGTSINKFISAIVVDSDFTENGRLTLSDIMTMKLCDKYFIIMSSRIFSLGQIINFQYQWPKLKSPTEYHEDLGLFLWDYSNDDFPGSPDDPQYFKYRLRPHPAGKELHRELTLPSGLHVRYTYMNGKGEKYLMALPDDEQSKNKELIARDLHMKINDNWVKVQNFKSFKAKDMAFLRNDVFEVWDPIIELATELENPHTGEVIPYPILGTNDFFYPREV